MRSARARQSISPVAIELVPILPASILVMVAPDIFRLLSVSLPKQPPRLGSRAGHFLDVGRGQRGAADRPFAAFDFLDAHPGHRPHRLAFDRDHRVGNLLDHALFLLGCENALDELDIDEGHGANPLLMTSQDRPGEASSVAGSAAASSGTESGRYRN